MTINLFVVYKILKTGGEQSKLANSTLFTISNDCIKNKRNRVILSSKFYGCYNTLHITLEIKILHIIKYCF